MENSQTFHLTKIMNMQGKIGLIGLKQFSSYQSVKRNILKIIVEPDFLKLRSCFGQHPINIVGVRGDICQEGSFLKIQYGCLCTVAAMHLKTQFTAQVQGKV